jgi:hypothetical protein
MSERMIKCMNYRPSQSTDTVANTRLGKQAAKIYTASYSRVSCIEKGYLRGGHESGILICRGNRSGYVCMQIVIVAIHVQTYRTTTSSTEQE